MLVGIIALIISVIVVFNHDLIWLLAIFPGLYIAYVSFIVFSRAPELKASIHLTPTEKVAWQQHHAFFRFPFAAKGMATSLSILQLISVILGVALLVTGLFWGIAFVAFWFILGMLTPRLSPLTTFVPAAQKGNPEAINRVQALESLSKKLNTGSGL